MAKSYLMSEFAGDSKALAGESYEERYQRSINDPDGYWAQIASEFKWIKFPTIIKNASFDPVDIKWFEDGVLNLTENCIDRHLATRANQTAIIWEADEPGTSKSISYQELYHSVCRFGNVLKAQGVKKGDRVTINMPMIPEAAYAMLACARIGAIHSVIFGGFSAEAIANRIEDCQSRHVITADYAMRGGKSIGLKQNMDDAISRTTGVECVIVIRHTGGDVDMKPGRDWWYHELASDASDECAPEPMNAEDPLFILYTSGSTGKPKGVLHTTGGYMVYAATTHRTVFDYRDGEVYWCTADVGWITGHSYILYGPLANGATTLMFEGVPNYPTTSRFWEVVDKHKVNIFYTAPTAIRALMKGGVEPVERTSRESLRILGTVGEPINPEAWEWYFNVIGSGTCPIVDTWWQTETGGIMISALSGVTDMKPGSATLPCFGVKPELLDTDGTLLEGEADGCLVLADSWPGQMRTVYGDHERFIQTYFSTFKARYFTGDGCRRDSDGYYWITGRIDDVINVSGHRLGTAEIESALVAHDAVVEAAVVGYPHDIKGQGIYAYVILRDGLIVDDQLAKILIKQVRTVIGPISTPDKIHITSNLPKTRSGKIMRRILRKIAEDDFGALGDVSTLADASVVDELIAGRQNRKSDSTK